MRNLPSGKTAAFVEKLLHWASENLREFEWRNTSDPYKIMVAELMLQRTKAEQVEGIYIKFLERFPDVRTLAGANVSEIEEVIRPLGLGYRAGRMKEIAGKIEELFNGSVPNSWEELMKLPGIGSYIASTVMCLAFKKDVPVFDSNVARVIGRVFSIEVTAESHKKREFWQLMGEMLPSGKSREFNLALLDLGSLVCTPRNPGHEKCPLRGICDFYRKSGSAA